MEVCCKIANPTAVFHIQVYTNFMCCDKCWEFWGYHCYIKNWLKKKDLTILSWITLKQGYWGLQSLCTQTFTLLPTHVSVWGLYSPKFHSEGLAMWMKKPKVKEDRYYWSVPLPGLLLVVAILIAHHHPQTDCYGLSHLSQPLIIWQTFLSPSYPSHPSLVLP